MASLMMMGVLPMASQSLNLSSYSYSYSSQLSQLSFSRSEGLGVSTTTTPVSVSIPIPIPIPATSSPYTLPLIIYCGRGDKKTAKGKRFKQSFGNARPKNKNKGRGPPRVAVPPGPPRKDEFEDDEIVDVDLDDDLFP